MKLKKLRIFVAGLLTAAMVPTMMMTPVQARVFLTECERQAQNECLDELGGGRINDPEFAICYETKRAEYCAPPPPWPCTSPFGCTGPQPW